MKQIYTFLFLILILCSFAVAQPTNNPQTDHTLFLQTNSITTHIINQDFYLHAHAFYTANGVAVDPALLTCNYHLYSESSGWEHISVGTLSPYSAGVFADLAGTNFTEYTKYSILMWCKDNDNRGGFAEFKFYTVDTHLYERTTYTGIAYFTIILIFLIITLALGYFGLVLIDLDNPLKYLFILLSFLFATLTSFFVYSLSKTVQYAHSNVLLTVFSIMGIITFLMFVYTLIVFMNHLINKKDMMNPYKSNSYGKNKY